MTDLQTMPAEVDVEPDVDTETGELIASANDELTAETIELLIEKGYDPAFGARPMRRAVERQVDDEQLEIDHPPLAFAHALERPRLGPEEALEGATVVTTDVWASMGQEDEAAERQRAFDGFIVDDGAMKRAASDAIFLHCLPAHRGEEVSASVIDGSQSRVWDEAENRLHTQKALLEWLLD